MKRCHMMMTYPVEGGPLCRLLVYKPNELYVTLCKLENHMFSYVKQIHMAIPNSYWLVSQRVDILVIPSDNLT